MRSYHHYCSIARGLDVVGDRWTLLLVRELLLRGACRFTDLRDGLPGAAANLLSTRLKELEEAGIVRRQYAGPPVASQLYELTDDGLQLEPVLRALGIWGLRYMADERRDDAFHAEWLAYAASWSIDAEPDGPAAKIQLEADDQRAVVELGDGQVRCRVGEAEPADLTLRGPARTILGLLVGRIDLSVAMEHGLSVDGDPALLHRLRPALDRQGQSATTTARALRSP
jgi:DNA-binding HxlR family transcriptional regulator